MKVEYHPLTVSDLNNAATIQALASVADERVLRFPRYPSRLPSIARHLYELGVPFLPPHES